ncbi:MAG: hypothetical protein HUK20_00035 [Fibrobacter sp.]|nr:hypothetical protein [Fibrobacter sp.]
MILGGEGIYIFRNIRFETGSALKLYSRQKPKTRFRGPKLQIDDRIYQLLGNGKIDRSNWLEIQIGKRGESFPIIFLNENGSISYGENNL